jgi:hypothetical protein
MHAIQENNNDTPLAPKNVTGPTRLQTLVLTPAPLLSVALPIPNEEILLQANGA